MSATKDEVEGSPDRNGLGGVEIAETMLIQDRQLVNGAEDGPVDGNVVESEIDEGANQNNMTRLGSPVKRTKDSTTTGGGSSNKIKHNTFII